MANNWKHDRAKSAIDARIKDVETVTIVDYKRETSLESIPTNKAYRMDAVHLYVDIQNFEAILSSTEVDGVTAHKRALRFLDLHQRAVHRILQKTDTRRVDFHGQRLHAVVAKPYGEADEATRVHRAIAIAQLVTDVLAETGDDDQNIPDAEVRVGIDTGRALVVNNGRSGYREPLFLGQPANMAAKLASRDGAVGIFLTNEARRAVDLDEVDDDDLGTTPLTAGEIEASIEAAKLEVSKDTIVKGWRKDNDDYPIGSFVFSRTTPPIRHLDIPSLTPGNSRRMETVSVYADSATSPSLDAPTLQSALAGIPGWSAPGSVGSADSAPVDTTARRNTSPETKEINWFRRYFRDLQRRAEISASEARAPTARRTPRITSPVRDRLQRMPAHRLALIEALLTTVPTEHYLAVEETIYRLVQVGPDWDTVRELAATAPEPCRSRAAGLLVAKRIALFL